MAFKISVPIRIAIGTQELVGTVEMPAVMGGEAITLEAPDFRASCAATLRALADELDGGTVAS